MNSTNGTRLDKGLRELLSKAIDLDQRGLKKEACQKYLRASKILIKLSNSSDLPSVRKHYLTRAQECVDRVRYLSGIKKKSKGWETGLTRPPSIAQDTTTEEEEDSVVSEEDEDARRLTEMVTDTILSERPDVAMSEVAGLDDAKQAIDDAIIAPMKHPELFKGKTRQPWKGILLYGPAGCGKTLIAKAVATEVNATFFNVSAANIVSKWLGESERLVKHLFESAREKQPSIVFIDELDSIGISRRGEDVGGERRLKTQLLTELQGLTSKTDERVTLIGATNLPWDIDFALRSRFEKRISVPLPDRTARTTIFKTHIDDIEVAADVDFQELADLTEGYSGRDISVVCREAAMEPIREIQRSSDELQPSNVSLRAVSRMDFLNAIDNIRPATSPEDIRRYKEWAEGS